jgi:dihydroorotase
MMAQKMDMVLRGGTLVTPAGLLEGDVGSVNGRIAALGDLSGTSASETIDVRGLHVLPGVIDSQVHFREPGNEHKEDLQSGSRAAVLGGVTAVFEMPNTNPATTTAAALADKISRALGRMHCDFAFYVGASNENVDELANLEGLPGCAGIKMFMGSSTGSLLVSDDGNVGQVLAQGRRRVAVHSEDEARLVARKGEARMGEPASHMVWRDAQTALLCTQRLLNLARAQARRVHVLHVTTGEEMDLLRNAKDFATVEVTPQHLTLAAPECYARLGTYAQMNPPIRDQAQQDALWRAVTDGTVDVIGSDHAPHTREEKEKTYPASPSGMPGVQTLVPIMLNHVARGRLTLQRLVDLTSHGPARVFSLAGKGRIAAGYDADFTVVDLKMERIIENDWIASRCGWTPFAGHKVRGWPRGTIIRGHKVMWDDVLLTKAIGLPVRFQETFRRAH